MSILLPLSPLPVAAADRPVAAGRFHFVRHGQTEDNLRGVRCGGDRDVPLTVAGQDQARAAAARFAAGGPACGVILAGPLQRTQATAAIFAERLAVPVITTGWLRERILGAWNGLPVATTRAWFDAGLSPPGGETEAQFADRVAAGLARLATLLPRQPLLVGSKGIGRMLFKLLAGRPAVEVGNCDVIEFRLAPSAGGHRWQATAAAATPGTDPSSPHRPAAGIDADGSLASPQGLPGRSGPASQNG